MKSLVAKPTFKKHQNATLEQLMKVFVQKKVLDVGIFSMQLPTDPFLNFTFKVCLPSIVSSFPQ